MKKVFLTGGSGFLGRNILEQLSDKFEFFSPSHEELDLLNKDDVEKYFQDNFFDIVIHTANRGGSRKEAHLTDVVSSNLHIFFNLLCCQKHFKRMIFLGSGAEYDKRVDIADIREDQFGEYVPADDYGFYKYICSRFIERTNDIINLRIFGMFGKYEDYDMRFISNAICKTLFDLPITMKQNVFFDYVYVNDFVRIIEHFIENEPKEKFYNIGTGKKIDLLTLADIIKEVSCRDVPVNITYEGLNKEYTCDNTRLLSEIKGFKFTDFKQSTKELFEWYKFQPLIKKHFEKDI